MQRYVARTPTYRTGRLYHAEFCQADILSARWVRTSLLYLEHALVLSQHYHHWGTTTSVVLGAAPSVLRDATSNRQDADKR